MATTQTQTPQEAARQLFPLAKAHADAEEYVAGTYGGSRDGTFEGCSIGCTIYDAQRAGLLPGGVEYSNFVALAELLYGGEERLAELQEEIYEELATCDTEAARQWTPRLLRAIAEAPADTDWSGVFYRWVAETLDELLGLDTVRPNKTVAAAIRTVRDLYRERAEPSDARWNDAWSTAGHAQVHARDNRPVLAAFKAANDDTTSTSHLAAEAHEPAYQDAWLAHADRLVRLIREGG